MYLLNNACPAIVFDFGGVLLDWNPHYLYRKLFNNDASAIERFLTEIGFEEWNLRLDEGRPFSEGVAELSAQFPQYADLIRAYDECWEESIGGVIQPTLDIVHSLKRAGYALYGLSNWSAETFRRVRPTYKFFDLFEDIVLSGDVKLNKPDPRIYAVLLERAGRKAAECLFIDDSEENVIVASQLGFETVRFKSPEQLKKELDQRGFLISNRAELDCHYDTVGVNSK
jgi:2-haloacid dehalogenase